MSKPDILSKEMAKDFRRGLLKFFIFKMLDKQDMHSYAMMMRIEDISGWKLITGSMHPSLMKLCGTGYISFKVVGMKKVYSITKKGKIMIKQLDDNFDSGLNAIKTIFENL